jgi:beta-1,4-mannosyl-glycoprotein beta-1,4-N-acetylglucosaminyltransferase
MKPKIYDCTTFFQSELLFNIRFELLKDIVDYFVICEATKTHTGRYKKLILILKN